ncbi:MAG: peptidase S16 [Acidimicrobiaceae bacterium]|nr:peptidase S16 [Acidimicrobiaceae bacterium]
MRPEWLRLKSPVAIQNMNKVSGSVSRLTMANNEQALTASEENTPQESPMFPLGTVLLPGSVLPLHIFEDRYRQLAEFCTANNSNFGVVLIERGHEVGGGDTRSTVGCSATIVNHERFPDGRWALVVLGTTRLRIEEWLADAPYPRARTTELPEEMGGATMQRALQVLEKLETFVQQAQQMGYQVASVDGDAVVAGLNVTELSYRIAELTPVGPFDKQTLLMASTVATRIDLIEEQIDGLSEILAAGGNKP